MKVLFYANRCGNIIDKLIRFKTATWKQRLNGSWRDLPSHVELLFRNGEMFSASQYENKTRYKRFLGGPAWNVIELSTTNIEESIAKVWCNNHTGKKYDYLGILGFVLPFVKDSPDKWFCSEACAEALTIAGKIEVNDTSRVSPAVLYDMLIYAP